MNRFILPEEVLFALHLILSIVLFFLSLSLHLFEYQHSAVHYTLVTISAYFNSIVRTPDKQSHSDSGYIFTLANRPAVHVTFASELGKYELIQF